MTMQLVITLLGAFAASFVVGAAGFGDALVLAAVWLYVMDPVTAVPLIVATGFLMHVIPLFRLRHELSFEHLPPFIVTGALGVPVGVWLLTVIDPNLFRVGVGTVLLVYSLFMLVSQKKQFNISHFGVTGDGIVGFIGGILGGFAGLSGILPTLWSGLKNWSKNQQRGVFQPFVLAMHALTLGALAWQGLVDETLFISLLQIFPVVVLGSWAGLKIYRYLNDEWFKKTVLALLLVSALGLLGG